MNRIGNVQLWVLSSKLTFILLRIRIIGSLPFVGSASLERNVLDVKSHVLPLTLFSDTSFNVKKCQDGDHNYLPCEGT